MKLAQCVLEMAASYRSEFVPEEYRVFVKKDSDDVTLNVGRYVVGKTHEGVVGLFSIPSVSAIPVHIPNERVARLLESKFENFSEVRERIIETLLGQGYQEITDIAKA